MPKTKQSAKRLFENVNAQAERKLVDKLREIGLDQYVELPQITVMGDTSSGKSLLLSAISGVSFPSYQFVAGMAHELNSLTDDKFERMMQDSEQKAESEQEQRQNSPRPVEIAFSASAGVFVYQMGVAAYIQDHFDLSNCQFSGCSGGSWAAALLASETPVRQAWSVIKETQAEVITSPKWYSGYGRYATIVKQTLHKLWRDDKDIHKRVEQRHLTIAVTRFPSMQAEKHTSWDSLDDLTGSIMASSLVPFALSGKPCITHRGQWYVDGAFTNFKGVNCEEYSTWADLSFHTAQTVLGYARSTSSTIAGYLLPGAWGKLVANKIFNSMPMLTSPHDTIAQSPSSSSDEVQRLIIKPWNWRSPSVSSFHLSVDLATHEQNFELGYEDARLHCEELEALLLRKNPPTAC
ncbi:hypothetical protein BBO99_00005873 [Phytophthora kernoviae]|uniref:PNPLA domain-containing protein n=2 Tax=Phytophthora kernoviae TaxID=325452 RepID=A0A421GME9_9STRA|nr:hypothetical protein G195_006552 [Phytophthora kernoviae 00238/432]KAG2522619.1 hypothetical protein JM16_003401 [Phytophthora kernoviae]KAG2524282.1 hypothetical protein JM18_005164 [Phytophthora kernoviae]RLN45726.1 hypothetical protein BBI17_005905 [Phytophthora kernoviae]RLN78572.1 hypothetical protein BBO99_00005873 [Phytophthora kernoviae]